LLPERRRRTESVAGLYANEPQQSFVERKETEERTLLMRISTGGHSFTVLSIVASICSLSVKSQT
jgi:hypothetical protein